MVGRGTDCRGTDMGTRTVVLNQGHFAKPLLILHEGHLVMSGDNVPLSQLIMKGDAATGA